MYDDLIMLLRAETIVPYATLKMIRDAADAIEELQKQRKTGKWIEGYKCSECGYPAVIKVKYDGSIVWENAPFNFCPHCGARMVNDDV